MDDFRQIRDMESFEMLTIKKILKEAAIKDLELYKVNYDGGNYFVFELPIPGTELYTQKCVMVNKLSDMDLLSWISEASHFKQSVDEEAKV